ncbi:unnamed protein product [Mytilus edulis]|uniref:Ig-like domain-containing protein n=1 Tax=Mytilus edulis TaxID=6550 RepID=A0A8S3SQN4_MYTED|nr:unnamed protein product [Mytilus edulis]
MAQEVEILENTDEETLKRREVGQYSPWIVKDIKDVDTKLTRNVDTDRNLLLHVEVVRTLRHCCDLGLENQLAPSSLRWRVRKQWEGIRSYFYLIIHMNKKIFSREQINATRMAIIILEILTSALYDLFISDCGGFYVKPRDECDITYLYAQLRRNNKHIPGHGWGCKWSDIQNSHILIGDDIERIRVLHRLETYNGKGKLYTDQMKNVKKKETKLQDWQTYQKKITYEFPRLKLKPSFEVKVGGGCTLECETVVPLPDGSKVYWVKEKTPKK